MGDHNMRQSVEAEAPERREAPEQRVERTSTPPTPRPNLLVQGMRSLSTGLRTLSWARTILYGVAAGVLMPLLFAQAGFVSFFAGIIPVGAGLLLGRSAKSHYTLHGFIAGAIGAATSIGALWWMLFASPLGAAMIANLSGQEGAAPPSLEQAWVQLGGFIAFSLLVFCTFGASMAGRTAERNRALEREIETRGGRLQRAGAIRTPDDIRGLSLPQLGWYVNNLFKKKGFQFKDYRFIDKDKHLDLWLEREGEIWHLRTTVAEKVGAGTIESLNQELKREGCRKGVVIASMDFQPSAVKSAKGRPIVLIDGQTLFEISQG